MDVDLVTRLRGWLDEDVPIGVIMNEAADRIEQLEAALREIAKHSRGGVIDTTEKMDRDEFIGIARAALEGK